MFRFYIVTKLKKKVKKRKKTPVGPKINSHFDYLWQKQNSGQFESWKMLQSFLQRGTLGAL